MQAISISEARQNFKQYCDDVIENRDVIIVSRNGNGKENMVWMDLLSYNNLIKAKENLTDIIQMEENRKLENQQIKNEVIYAKDNIEDE